MAYFNKAKEYRLFQKQDNTYVVMKGDSLYKIAKKYNVSIEELMKYNNLEGTLIYPDQILVIPQVINDKVYFLEYVSNKDDSLNSIALKYNLSIDEILKYNDLGKFILTEGQLIVIPQKFNTYVVKESDTLRDILNNTNMTLEELVNENFNTLFKVGTSLYVKWNE